MARKYSSWAVGYSLFAAVLLLMVGTFHVIAGVVALFRDEFYVVTQKWVFEFNVTTWGWIHILLGLALALSGYLITTGNLVGRIVGILVALGSAIANFAWLPYQPWWSVLMIALSVAVIWALALHGHDIDSRSEVNG